VEKRGRAAATVITQGFVKAAEIRAQALGMPAHPVVIIDHPIASKSREQILELARKSVDEVASYLMSAIPEARHE
jgi:hypothetical protein